MSPALRSSRRAFLLGLAASLVACGRRGDGSRDGDGLVEVHELHEDGDGDGAEPMRGVVLLPRWGRPDEKLPVLVALPGRAEALRGPASALAWLREYELARAIGHLRNPPLPPAAFHGHVDPSRLQALQRSLAERPFRGLVVLCPSIPEALAKQPDLHQANAFGRRVLGLLPQLRAMRPGLAEPLVGIDGVSFGGRLALDVGLLHARSFAAVGALQPALRPGEGETLVDRARKALAENPRLRLRLVTSRGDDFRDEVTALHTALDEGGLPHEYALLEGPHGYAFNRGPGAIEMLLWHDRVLRGEPGL